MTTAVALALELADEIEAIFLGDCGPSDDPDKQYAYTAGFRDMAKRFVAAVKRIGDPDLSEMVRKLSTSPEDIVAAHELRADLIAACDALREAASDPKYAAKAAERAAFISPELVRQLGSVNKGDLDPKKLVRLCEELNDAYGRGNYLSAVLLARAIMNHVPPVFGQQTFAQVVSQSGRSMKGIFERLEHEARPIADLHTHILMRRNETLPTKNQLEPYKAGFEILLQEVLVRLQDAAQG